jgi:hypothetical protein
MSSQRILHGKASAGLGQAVPLEKGAAEASPNEVLNVSVQRQASRDDEAKATAHSPELLEKQSLEERGVEFVVHRELTGFETAGTPVDDMSRSKWQLASRAREGGVFVLRNGVRKPRRLLMMDCWGWRGVIAGGVAAGAGHTEGESWQRVRG